MLIWEKHTFKDAIGYGIWKSKHRYIEVWKFPAGYEISSHSHNNENIETMLLFGVANFYRQISGSLTSESFQKLGPLSNLGKCLSIPAGALHWFCVDKKWPLIVINFSRFINNVKPMSASVDILFSEQSIKE